LAAITTDPFWISSTFSTGDVIRVETTCYSDCPYLVGIDAQPLNIYSFVVDAGEDLYIESGQSAQLSGWTSGVDLQWSPAFEVSATNVLNPIVSPEETTTFTLKATENGCTQSDQVTVHIITGIEIPNTFSPNGDGVNDTWLIQGLEDYPNNRLSIFTRWGQEVLTLSAYSEKKAWDGRTSAGNLAEGVYFYILEVDAEEPLIFNGTVNVIR
jgi:gliding motility-associated-like protein